MLKPQSFLEKSSNIYQYLLGMTLPLEHEFKIIIGQLPVFFKRNLVTSY